MTLCIAVFTGNPAMGLCGTDATPSSETRTNQELSCDDKGSLPANGASAGELVRPMVMLTFELDADYSEFADLYYAIPRGAPPFYIRPYLSVVGMSHDGAFHALDMRRRPIGCLYKLLSDRRRAVDPVAFATIPDADLKRGLLSSAARCAFLYDTDECLMVTTFLPADVIGADNTELPSFDSCGYLTARIPADNYTTLFRTLPADGTEGVSLYYERFGDVYDKWYGYRTSGNYPVFTPSRHPSFPFGSPHVRWLVVSGQAVSEQLVPRLRHAFDSHASLVGSVAWTSGTSATHEAILMPPVLLYQTYGVTLEPEFSTQLLEPQQLASTIEQWPSLLVGMYVVEDGNIQLVFFRGN